MKSTQLATFDFKKTVGLCYTQKAHRFFGSKETMRLRNAFSECTFEMYFRKVSSKYPFKMHLRRSSVLCNYIAFATIAFPTIVFTTNAEQKKRRWCILKGHDDLFFCTYRYTDKCHAKQNKAYKSKTFCESKTNFVATNENLLRKSKTKQKNRNILQIVREIQETISKKQLIESSTNMVLNLSGGQDSVFLLFCLSLLQTQISFTFKTLCCNHFWQTSSFYTTLHLTKYAVHLSCPLVGFLPLHITDLNLGLAESFFSRPVRFALLRKSKVSIVATKLVLRKQEVKGPECFVSSKCTVDTKRSRHTSSECCALVYASAGRKKMIVYAVYLHHFRNNRLRNECKTSFAKSKALGSALVHNTFRFRERGQVAYAYKSKNAESVKKFLPARRQLWQSTYNPTSSKIFTGLSSENIARSWRHTTTERSYTFYTLENALYGHSLSDRIETILFNLIRGTGGQGVIPLPWKRKFSHFSYNKFYSSLQRILKNTHIAILF